MADRDTPMASEDTLPSDEGDATAPPPARIIAPTSYLMGERIGRGGMGEVYAARDLRLERPVALKHLRHAADEDLRTRFDREARLTARLQHPGILPVYEGGVLPSGEPFYTMRKVEGRSLEALLRETKSLADRLALLPNLLAALDALAYAHSEGVIHRDLKPSNILVGRFGETVVIDWGLAKAVGEPDLPRPAPAADAPHEDHLTEVGAILGTRGFMAPEQARGEATDLRTDVYALGAVLGQLLGGKSANLLGELDAADLERAPRELAAIFRRATARDPEARYPSARELADEVRRFTTGNLVESHAYTRRELAARWIRRHAGVLIVAAVALALLVVIAAYAFVNIVHQREVAERQRRAADATALALETEQGRQALLDDDLDGAAQHLAAALARAPHPSPALRALTHELVASTQPDFEWQAHEGPVQVLISLPGGKLVASSGVDGAVRLWEVGSWRLHATLPGHAAGFVGVEVAPDGQRLATYDKVVHVWRTDGTLLETLPEGPGPLHWVSFGENGDVLYTWRLPGTLSAWRLGSKEPLYSVDDVAAPNVTPEGSTLFLLRQDGSIDVRDGPSGRPLWAVTRRAAIDTTDGPVFNRGGDLLAVPSPDGYAVTVYESRSGRPLRTIEVGSNPVTSFSFTGGRLLAGGGNFGSVTLWDPYSGAIAFSAATPVPQKVTYNGWYDDPSVMRSQRQKRATWLWDLDRKRVLRRIPAAYTIVVRAPEGRFALAALDDGRVAGYSLAKRPILTLAGGAAVAEARFSADSRRLLVAGVDGTLHIVDAQAAREVRAVGGGGAPGRFDEGPDGELALAVPGQPLRIFNSQGDAVTELPVRDADGVRYGRRGRMVVLRGAAGGELWDLAGPKRIAALPGATLAAAFSPDGARLVTGSDTPVATVWDATTGAPLARLEGHRRQVAFAEFTADGAHIVSASSSIVPGTYIGVRVWDAAGYKFERELRGHTKPIGGLALARDGRIAATASHDRTAFLWDLASGKRVATIENPGERLSGIALDARSELAVTSALDGAARLWDATGRLLAEDLAPGDSARGVALAPGAELAAVWYQSGLVQLWRVAP